MRVGSVRHAAFVSCCYGDGNSSSCLVDGKSVLASLQAEWKVVSLPSRFHEIHRTKQKHTCTSVCMPFSCLIWDLCAMKYNSFDANYFLGKTEMMYLNANAKLMTSSMKKCELSLWVGICEFLCLHLATLLNIIQWLLYT